MFSVAKQTFPAALLLPFRMHGAPIDARSCAGCGVGARFIISVAHLPQTKRRREGSAMLDLMIYRGVPVPELRLRTLVGKQSGPSAAPGCSPHPQS